MHKLLGNFQANSRCFWLFLEIPFPWATQNTRSNHLCCVPLALTKYIVKILLKDQHLLLPSVTMPLLCNSLPFLCYICIFKVCIFVSSKCVYFSRQSFCKSKSSVSAFLFSLCAGAPRLWTEFSNFAQSTQLNWNATHSNTYSTYLFCN